MTSQTHQSAPTEFIETNGIRFAYRRFGQDRGTPLVFLQHFRGGLDNWDPAVTDGLAAGRPVILFDNTGVGASSGETPSTIEEMADHAALFVRALHSGPVDLLGFSIGGFIAQEVASRHPDLVRKLVLVGTGPRHGQVTADHRVMKIASHDVPGLDDFLFLFFGRSAAAQDAGRAFWVRRHRRTDQDTPSSAATARAQSIALVGWHAPAESEPFAHLSAIDQPTLVVNGTDDVMVPTINSYTLAQHIPRAQLIIYPDAGHAAHFQYPDLFVDHARMFLDRDDFPRVDAPAADDQAGPAVPDPHRQESE